MAAIHDYTWQALISMGIAGLGSGALAPLGGYLTVWAVCASASFLAAALPDSRAEAGVQQRQQHLTVGSARRRIG